MSILGLIEDRIREGRLFPVDPILDPAVRTMVVSPEITQLLNGPWKNRTMETRCNFLRADLEAFVKNGQIGMCMTPFHADDAYFGLLDPPAAGIWDLRSRDPSPGLRVIGAFAHVDTFVGLAWSPRSVRLGWSEKEPLGDRDSKEWRDVIVSSQTQWRNLFATYNPVSGSNISDYISANAFSV